MKKTLLILCACLFGALTGVRAYTVDDLTAAGWSLATNLDDITNNVYVFVDAKSSNYVMSGITKKAPDANTNYTPTYVTLSNPCTTPTSVWTIESRIDGYALRNIESQKYFNGANYGWQDYMADTYDDCATFSITSSEGKYDIARISGNFWPGKYVGPWTDGGTISATEENIAANKEIGNAPGFFIYRMAKATYLQKYLQQTPNVTSPIDASYLIVNPTIYQGGSNTDMPTGWSQYDVDSQMRTEGTGDTKLKGWDDSFWKTLKLDYFQTIVNLPGGKYYMTAATRDSENHGKLKVYIYHNDSGRRSESDAANSTESDHTTEFLDLDGGSTVNIGIRTDGNSENSTVTGDNFRMSIDPYLSTMATELPANGAMTAGMWYHFTVDDSYKYAISATNLSNIIYATGENTALSAAGSTNFEAVQELASGTDYYVRSSSDNTLTITPCISSVATALPADGAMTAGVWYYFEAPLTSSYDFTATTLSDIVYTTNGDLAQNTTSVNDHLAAKNNALTAGTRYYLKSATAQTLAWTYSRNTDFTGLIVNPGFEGSYTEWKTYKEGTDKRHIYKPEGWTINYPTENDNDLSSLNSECLQWNFFAGLPKPTEGGNNTYWIRYRWGNSSVLTLSQDLTLPAGFYQLSAEGYRSSTNNGTAEISVKVGEDPASTAAFTEAAWTQKNIIFLLSSEQNVKIAYTFTQTAQEEIKAGVDNFRLTYLGDGSTLNLDFAEGAITDGITVCTYAADAAKVEGYLSGMQAVPGWTIVSNGDAHAAGVMNVNSNTGLGNAANVVPAVGYDALSNGKVLGIEAVWSATSQYVQPVTLPAGSYKIVMPIYNQAGTTAFAKNLFGFVELDGTEHYATATAYSVGSWTQEIVDLTLTEETSGYLSLGYTAANKGNGDMPHLFVDRVMICDASAEMSVKATVQWATFCAPFEVVIPSGVTAYTCASTTNGKLDMVEVTGGTISANTPVILNAEEGLPSTTFYGVKVPNNTSDLIEGGLLRGNVSTTAKDIAYTGKEYLLQRNDEKTGFYKMGNDKTYRVGFNRCYLVTDGISGARSAFFFGEDATAISVLEAAKAEAGAQKDGKYLENGKIVIVKNGVKYSANGQILK